MNWWGWWKGRGRGEDAQRRAWRALWQAAVEAEDITAVETLRSSLAPLRTASDDLEVELEMLDALEQLATLRAATAGGRLPDVETHHRVIAGETCHFTAPAFLPDDAAQLSGRVLFTSSRNIFVGGTRPRAVAWHLVRDIVRADRDLLLVRGDGSAAAHFRFNTFGDAVAAAFLARRLKGAKAPRVL